MKFKNLEIDGLGRFLFEIELSGKNSRMRTRFVRMLEAYAINVLQEERKAILEIYGMKDEHGGLVLNESETEVILIPEKENEFHAEMNELMNEYFIIDENEANREMILTTAKAILECDIKLSKNDAIIYDQWCEEFEKSIEHYAIKEEA